MSCSAGERGVHAQRERGLASEGRGGRGGGGYMLRWEGECMRGGGEGGRYMHIRGAECPVRGGGVGGHAQQESVWVGGGEGGWGPSCLCPPHFPCPT